MYYIVATYTYVLGRYLENQTLLHIKTIEFVKILHELVQMTAQVTQRGVYLALTRQIETRRLDRNRSCS